MTASGDGSKRSIVRLKKSIVEEVPRPAAGKRSAVWDVEVKGFGVRVTSNGVRTYVLRYRMGGRDAPQRFMTIGEHGSPWTTDQARRRALELLGQVRLGMDPAGARGRARDEAAASEDRRAARMFDVLADRWLERHVRRGNLRSVKDIEGVVRRDLKPAFAGRTIDEITKENVSDALELIGDRSESAANKAHKWLRQMYNWFIEKGLLERSPLDRMGQPFNEDSRTRVLGLLELVLVWVTVESIPEPFRSFYRVLILLGQRLREVANLSWAELDLDTGEWLLPAARTKNKQEHVIPLPAMAIAILHDQADGLLKPRGPVFTTDDVVGISGFSKLKQAVDEALAALLADHPAALELIDGTFEDWVVHDLRRSLATGCQAMGVQMEVTEAVLNHVSGRRGGLRGIPEGSRGGRRTYAGLRRSQPGSGLVRSASAAGGGRAAGRRHPRE
ncbi:tyrosine-type recombinase/integrase [Sphingomonas sp. TWP1-3-1]|uniref:tyrosine-type recombinase/integrase n=1 Tax=Sphingomonas sp. TWP1-3-1 TaxID=2804612 RepID=UPI003CEF8D53